MSERPLPARRRVVDAGAWPPRSVGGAVVTASAGARERDLPGTTTSGVTATRRPCGATRSATRRHAPGPDGPLDGHGHDHADPTTKNALSRGRRDRRRRPQDPTSRRPRSAQPPPSPPGAAPSRAADHGPAARAPRSRHPATRYADGRRLLHAHRRRRAALLPGNRPGPLPPLRRRARFVSTGGDQADRARPTTRVWSAGSTTGDRITFTRDGTPDAASGRPTAFLLTPRRRLRGLPRVAGQRHRRPVRRRHAVPGGARLRRRAHPRHGLRVPRRRRPLRQALGPVRRAVRPRRLPRPPQTDGKAPLEAVLSGQPTHDPVGWPTFKDWPAPHSLTHEGTYYKWMERSWRGGQRLFVNLLVENNQLCQLYPLGATAARRRRTPATTWTRSGCRPSGCASSRTTSTRSTAAPARAGTASSRTRSRRAGSSTTASWRWSWASRPACRSAARSRSGPAGRPRRLRRRHRSTGSSTRCTRWACARWSWSTSSTTRSPASPATRARPACWSTAPTSSRPAVLLAHGALRARRRPGSTTSDAARRARRSRPSSRTRSSAPSARCSAPLGTALPVYPPPAHCNQRGLTTLGEHLIDGLAERSMLFDPDHMSVAARDAAPRPWSRSWATPACSPATPGRRRTPTRGSTSSAASSRRTPATRPASSRSGAGTSTWADPRYYFGFGYGADINGLGAQGDPRGADVANPVTYPFTGLGGVTVRQAAQRRAGLRHQRRRRRAVRPLPRLDRGPAAGRRAARRRRRRDHRRHGARRRGLPADLGAGAGRHHRLLPQPAAAPSACAVPRARDPEG